MKNIAVLSVLVIILSVNSYAEESEGASSEGTSGEKNYCFSLGPQFGYIYGQVQEYVYPLPGETKGEFLSELTWDMKPVFYYGILAEFSRIDMMKAPGFFSSLSFKAGIPADSGFMEDRDWQSKENGDLTNYSRHTNKTNVFLHFDLICGSSFPINNNLIKLFIGGSWTRFAFTGRDGYGIYAREKKSNTYYPIDDNPVKYDYSGETVISYQQDWLILAAGFSIGTNIFYPFSFDVSFQISPFTFCAATDNHIKRNTIFRDYTGLGLFIEPSINMSFVIKKAEISLGLNYRHIGKTKGESYINENNAGFNLDAHKAGAGLSMLDLRFLASIRL
jgi:outer membrane protease